MGEVLQAGVGQAPARQAAIGAGLPKELPADTINKVCASSIRAVADRRRDDPRGRPRRDRHRRDGVDVERAVPAEEGALRLQARRRRADRLHGLRRADLAASTTSTWSSRRRSSHASSGISREDQDAWALRSHERAIAAQDAGRFADEIVPVDGFEVDEGPRRDTSLERLAALKPVFDPEGTTTAGNAPGVNDGAGCVIVTSEEFARKRGLEVLATIVSQGYVADDFAYLARTPAKAGAIALAKAGKSIDDVERVELNEAFSSVVLNSTKMLGADPEKVNVNGGAVALGHPIGASGARIVGDDGARPPPQRRRARPRGDLLRRRPGRRAAARGVTRLLLVLAVAGLAVVAAPTASACSCIAPGTPRADLDALRRCVRRRLPEPVPALAERVLLQVHDRPPREGDPSREDDPRGRRHEQRVVRPPGAEGPARRAPAPALGTAVALQPLRSARRELLPRRPVAAARFLRRPTPSRRRLRGTPRRGARCRRPRSASWTPRRGSRGDRPTWCR